MIVVKITNGGCDWFMKGTTWTGELDRADKFNDVILAIDAVLKTKKFMKASLFKTIQYIDI